MTARLRARPNQDVFQPIVDRFDQLMQLLAEGDLTLYGEISKDIQTVPREVNVGDTYVSCDGYINWYEVVGAPVDGKVFVRVFSPALRRGDYDLVDIEQFAARISPRLFQRARANGFRSVRAFS